MIRARHFVASSVLSFLVFSTAPAAEITIIPISASGTHTINGNEIVLEGSGQTVFLEIYVRGWDPDLNNSPLLRAFQANIDSNSYSSGTSGTITPKELACGGEPDPNEFCRSAFGGVCSLTGGACLQNSDCPFSPVESCKGSECTYPVGVGGLCQPGFIFAGRADYVFLLVEDLPAVDLSTPDFRYASAVTSDPVPDPGSAAYIGSLVLDVPPGSTGTFTIDMQTFPNSLLQDDVNQLIAPLDLVPATISVACQSTADCNDNNACTDDNCNVAGVCTNTPNFNASVSCCDPSDGSLTPLDDGNDCTDGVCDPVTGIVTQDPLLAATPCGDPTSTACNGPDTCDGAGTCATNDLPAGTPCGDPSSSECDDPDVCDNAGLCQPNFVALGTACGSGAITDCTDADTCDGAGACQDNDQPNGTTCDDGLFCNDGETCSDGLCGGGGPLSCDDGLSCTDDVCDELNSECDNTLLSGACLIGGICRAEDEFNPANDCEACITAIATTDWSFRPVDSVCDDGEACTGTGRPGIGVDTCDGAGVCAGLPDPQCNDNCPFAIDVFEGVTLGNNDNRGPDDTEASCQIDSNNDIWFVYTASCDGDVFVSTTGSTFTPSNDTVLSIYDDCPDSGGVEIACDDDSGVNLQSALTFTGSVGTPYYIRVAGFEDNSGDLVLNISTVDGCLIDDQCYLSGALNPANECEACIPAISTDAWSPTPEGSACGEGTDTECDSPDACDGAGVCETNPKPDGTACSDDGNECTFDFCGSGLCTHPPRPVDTPCGDPLDNECDNPDSCDAVGVCQSNYEPQGLACGDPSDSQCDNPDICDGGGLCDVNYEIVGTPCDDGDICTGDDICDTGSCAGTAIPEAPTVVASGSRYLLVTPNPGGSVAPVALSLTSPDWSCLDLYIQLDASLGAFPVFRTPDQWGTLEVTGEEIVPSSTYDIVAECGSFDSPPGSDTTGVWGDLVGVFSNGAWTPPNGIVDINDTVAMKDAFESLPTAPNYTQMDLAPCNPDGIITVLEFVYIVEAFQGLPFPCADPCP